MRSLKSSIVIVFCLTLAGCSAFKGVPGKSKITYKRTACYGTCPIYEMSIDGKGKVSFVGERFTEKLGAWEKTLDRQTCIELFTLLNSAAWDTLANEYPTQVSDLPSTVFRFRHKGIDKEVLVTGKHPEILDRIANRLKDIAESEDWTNLNIN